TSSVSNPITHIIQQEDSAMEWYLKVVKENYANFKGRARRKEYWMFFLLNLIVVMALAVVDFVIGSFPVIYMLYLLAVLVPSIAVFVRRMHDVGKSGWWWLIGLIPVIGSIWLLVLLCTDGDAGQNAYGPSPKAA
ncbi:MAG TPA: DUF805 domain-containing protein, partial [Bacteroidota bacterium]